MSAILKPAKADDEAALQLDANGNHRYLLTLKDLELQCAVTGGARSVITKQVTNGVAVRMAVLDRVSRSLATQ